MKGFLTAVRAELVQLETVWGVTTILRRDVITVLAHRAGHCDARTDVSALRCHVLPPFVDLFPISNCSEGETRTPDLTIMSRTL